MLLTHHSQVDLDLVGQIDCHGVLLPLHRGERAAGEPSLGGKVRVWDDDCGGVPQEGVVSDLAAVPPVVGGSGFGRLGECSHLHLL